MKKSILLIILLIYNLTFACSCNEILSFFKGAKIADKVILGRVLKKEFQIDNETKFNDKKQLENYLTSKKRKTSIYVVVLTVEVIETIRGENDKKIIEIYGGNFDTCWSSLSNFKLNNFYVVSLFDSINPVEYDNQFEESIGYQLGTCQENYLNINLDLNKATGIIKNKEKSISLKKIKKKIT